MDLSNWSQGLVVLQSAISCRGPPPEKQPRGEDPPQSEGDNGAAAPEPVEAGAQPFEAGQGEVAPTDPPALAAAPAPGSPQE
eukprot:4768688-Amphidinium_carterae.1